MATEQVGLLYDGYQRAQRNDTLTRVFRDVTGPDGAMRVCNSQLDFAEAYTATIRDMRSCGVAAVHSGLPIWRLIDKANHVDSQFKIKDFIKAVPGLIKASETSWISDIARVIYYIICMASSRV